MTASNKYSSVKRLPYFALALTLAACQATPPVSDDIRHALDDEPKAATAPVAAPSAEVNAALLPPLTATPTAPREQRFDIAVKEAPARDFFMGLVEGSPYNMMVHPGVGGTITLSLRNVTVNEVMEAVRNVYGYDFTYRAGIFEVLPSGLATRIFPINYLNLKRLGESRTRVNSGQVVQNGGSSSGGGSSNSSSGGGGNSSNVSQIPSTDIKTDTDVDLWGELGGSLHALVGEGDGRQVVMSPQTGVVIVRAPTRELRAVEDFLTRAQLTLQRQVILEARILEVELSDGFQSGINWSKLGSIHGNPFNIGISGTSLGGITPQVPLPAVRVAATDTNPLGGVFAGTYASDNFDGAVELLKTQGTVQVLSSPRISTINNQKAVIKVGSDEFFVTNISSNNTTNSATGTSQETPNITFTPFFSGIALDVTPQISEAGDITLHMHPSVSKVTDQTKTLTVNSKATTVPLALSTTRESDSIVRAKSGQVVVIGGLMQNQSNDNEAGAPGLSKIPVLGYLFKQKRNSTKKSELVILLRPIVASDDSWADQVKATRARFKDLDYPLDTSFKP